ncbi:kinase-like domain-containing protein [Catenaria anguillulae PL171]|uniref:Kinase-like domain-containing protein n=1 Tax=Catenaria anguillulae PL171 TaxID=765915 RepID=A0A1Y2I3P1_9FUNG|nr:kinase-like domain-containing protein [Catenaria anguillulae PL171]
MLGRKGPSLRINVDTLATPGVHESPAPLTAHQGPLAAVATTAALGELRQADLVPCEKLGEGASGAVHKCIHKPTNTILARKTVALDPSSTPMVVRELTLMHAFDSPHIVKYFGCYQDESDPGSLCICMEYCDLGSLDAIAKRVYARGGFLTEDLLGAICVATLKALHYLHKQHRVIHRDIKPSNILVNTRGDIKLCDFGVSGLLVESMANTFVGTSFYMAPERIQGHPYTVRSDVWSLGITMLELALGKFPYPFMVDSNPRTSFLLDGSGKPLDQQLVGKAGNLPIFEVLDYIINQPAPAIPQELIYSASNPQGRLSDGFRDFVTRCLVKDAATRPNPDVISQHGFVRHWAAARVDTAAWARMVDQCR